VTVQNTYLSISGIEVYTGAPPATPRPLKSTTVTNTSNERTIKTGGSAPYNIPAGTKGTFNTSTARQSTDYSGSYKADWAFKGPNQFTHTKNGVGQWWEVGFSTNYWVDKVRILNRKSCCGGRLSLTKVFIGDQYCGQVQNGCRNGQWYEVKCSKPVYGGKVRLVTVQNTYLSISGIEVYTGAAGSTTTTTSTSSTTYNIPAGTKGTFNTSTARQSTNYSGTAY
jgi:hypothetical protein